jgi:hypothetical protein
MSWGLCNYPNDWIYRKFIAGERKAIVQHEELNGEAASGLTRREMPSSSGDMLLSHRSSPILNVASLSYLYSSFLGPATAL